MHHAQHAPRFLSSSQAMGILEFSANINAENCASLEGVTKGERFSVRNKAAESADKIRSLWLLPPNAAESQLQINGISQLAALLHVVCFIYSHHRFRPASTFLSRHHHSDSGAFVRPSGLTTILRLTTSPHRYN